jgi:hypothetical protein
MNLASNTAAVASTRPPRVADIDLGLARFTRRWTSVMACPVFASYQRRLIQLSLELVNQYEQQIW